MTATAAMLLVDRGQLSLDHLVSRYLPDFQGEGRERMTLRHLLTHTSGLPDMLPDNVALRQRNAPLRDYVAGAIRTPLLFAPGTRTSYQSMGILLAAAIVEQISGQPLRQFLEAEVFRPFQMSRTALGLGKFTLRDVVANQVQDADPPGGLPETAHWDWNSAYWRNLGAPWGGAHATAADIARFLGGFLHPTGRPLRVETARAMTVDHNRGLDKPYGIGWAITPGGFGHGGSTGTLCWADVARNATFVLLTSQPARVSQKTILDPVAAAVRAAL